MRCFIHTDREAVAVCLVCGKAMCMPCSAVDAHSGRCPNCRLSDTKSQLNEAKAVCRSRRTRTVVYFIVTLLLAALTAVYALSTLGAPPILTVGFLAPILTWPQFVHYIITGVPGLAALIFLICLIASLAKGKKPREARRALEKAMTEINLQMNSADMTAYRQ